MKELIMATTARTLANRPTKLVPSNAEGIYEIINYYMQNKPNFQNNKMNINSAIAKAYENKYDWTLGENKPNQSQFKPKNESNKPKQTQFQPRNEANKPNQTQSQKGHRSRMPLKEICYFEEYGRKFSYFFLILVFFFFFLAFFTFLIDLQPHVRHICFPFRKNAVYISNTTADIAILYINRHS